MFLWLFLIRKELSTTIAHLYPNEGEEIKKNQNTKTTALITWLSVEGLLPSQGDLQWPQWQWAREEAEDAPSGKASLRSSLPGEEAEDPPSGRATLP